MSIRISYYNHANCPCVANARERMIAMKIALAQTNPIVGDIKRNADHIADLAVDAERAGADLIVFSELAVFGYPPKDLLMREEMIRDNLKALDRIASAATRATMIVGYVQPVPDQSGKGIYNAAAICRAGKIIATYAKRLLPTYDVFDEARYFSPGRSTCVVSVPVDSGKRSVSLGLTICEDIWNDAQFGGRPVYEVDPVAETVRDGAEWIINVGASPFVAGKQNVRAELFGSQVSELEVPLVSVNQVGGNDDLLFDGASFILDEGGRLLAQAPAFEEALLIVDTDHPQPGDITPYPEKLESIRLGLTTGIRDYLNKCGFHEALVGLSGGIDSAVTVALAADALGPDHVFGVAMPSRFSSDHSLEDARAVAANLGIRFDVIPIESTHEVLDGVMKPHLLGLAPDITEENMQARIRGVIMMALSNKHGRLLLTTGNKSELAVGYCTLYGDMCGGLAVLSDVPKITVYELARHINERRGETVIPLRTIEKPPSAELREGQQDSDSLPPYDVLDAILQRYIEEDWSIDRLVDAGFPPSTVQQIVRLVDRNEYKRQQAATGIKVTSRAFGSGRRMPIAARY